MLAVRVIECVTLAIKIATLSINITTTLTRISNWPCGLMDKTPDFGSGDCRFESYHGRSFLLKL